LCSPNQWGTPFERGLQNEWCQIHARRLSAESLLSSGEPVCTELCPCFMGTGESAVPSRLCPRGQ
jgi:hypothetical protein